MTTPTTTTTTTRCTIVSAYYRFPSKHSSAEYDEWARRFLGSVETPMVLFCDDETEPILREMRGVRPALFVLMPLAEAEMSKVADWDAEHARDPEASIHTKSLYVMWNEKAAYVQRAMALNPYRSTAFAWCDIGCFRSDLNLARLRKWPEGPRLDGLDPERLTLLNIQPFEPGDEAIDPVTRLPPCFDMKLRVGGTIMIGHRRAWDRWIPLYYAVLQRYLNAKFFAGKDQNVMASLVMLRPDLVTLVAPSRAPEHGDPWFYLQPYFSDVVPVVPVVAAAA